MKPPTEKERAHVVIGGSHVSIEPDIASFVLPPSCNPSRFHQYLSLADIKEAMREKSWLCQPVYDLSKKVAKSKEYVLLLSGCDIDSMSVYLTSLTPSQIESSLKEYIPMTMRLHRYPAGDCGDAKYEAKYYTESGWSIASFPYGINFGDGDGAAMQSQYCFRSNGNHTVLIVFINNQCTASTTRWPENVRLLLSSFRFVSEK
jgi:hypothetical protein